MNNYIILTLDKLESIERRYGTLGTVIGVILIILTIAATVLTISFTLKFSFVVIQWIFTNFFGFKLF